MLGLTLRKIARSVHGGTAMTFALFLPVLLLLIGGAVDFSRMIQLRSELQDAADAASIGSIAVNSDAFKAGVAMTGDGTVSTGTTQAQTIFTGDMRPHSDLTGVTSSAVITKTGTTITSIVTANASYTSNMLGLFNNSFAHIPISITSTSSATVPPYIDFYLLLDNSPSMGLGATTADINKLVAATATKSSDNNCAFACHELDKPSTGSNMDYYDLAKSIGVTMRIDVVRQATQNLMTTASTTETQVNQYRMAIYDFGLTADSISATAPGAYQISALNSNLTQSSTNAAAIDLMTVAAQNDNSDRQTNFTSVLADMNTRIPAEGSGLSSTSTQKVLFIVSDGVNDGYDCGYSNGSSCRRITPMNTATCTTLKARGVRIAVLYTTYLLLNQGQNSFFDSYVRPYLTPTSQVATAMQSCASPGLYFEVSPSQGISDAMQALFKKVVSVVRIDA